MGPLTGINNNNNTARFNNRALGHLDGLRLSSGSSGPVAHRGPIAGVFILEIILEIIIIQILCSSVAPRSVVG